MQRLRFSRLALLLLIGLAGVPLAHRAAEATEVAAAISRTLDPVVLTGSQLANYQNAPVGELWVYVFRSGSGWSQIPFQVDEVRSDGRFAAPEDGVFDANDQIVFMAKDLGDKASARPDTASYEVTVSDPLDPTAQGWAYVVRSSTATQTFTDDYVSFDNANRQIIGSTYKIGYNAATPGSNPPTADGSVFEYLTLGNGADILDRTPKVLGCLQNLCVSEDLFAAYLTPIKDGPVRVILRGSGTTLTNEIAGYSGMLAVTSRVTSIVPPTRVILSTDFNAQANGSKLYNAAVPAGVIVDGQPETMPETPVSPWWQLNTDTGTMISVTDYAPFYNPATGSLKNIYLDDGATPTPAPDRPSSDPGHWGEIGVRVDNAKQTFTFTFSYYFPAGLQPTEVVGETYASRFTNPLTAAAKFEGKVFLPLIVKQ